MSHIKLIFIAFFTALPLSNYCMISAIKKFKAEHSRLMAEIRQRGTAQQPDEQNTNSKHHLLLSSIALIKQNQNSPASQDTPQNNTSAALSNVPTK